MSLLPVLTIWHLAFFMVSRKLANIKYIKYSGLHLCSSIIAVIQFKAVMPQFIICISCLLTIIFFCANHSLEDEDRERALQAYIQREGVAPEPEDLFDKHNPRPPKFKTQIRDLPDLNENDSAHFECRLVPIGDPTMKIEWFRNGEPMVHGKFPKNFDFSVIFEKWGWIQSCWWETGLISVLFMVTSLHWLKFGIVSMVHWWQYSITAVNLFRRMEYVFKEDTNFLIYLSVYILYVYILTCTLRGWQLNTL